MNRYLFMIISTIAITSCASVKDPWMVAFGISDSERSAALTRAGETEYYDRLEKGGDLSALDRSREYLQAALRYNPLNAEASRLIGLVENYRSSNAAAAMAKARELLKKSPRTADEEYRMHAAIQRASELMPKDTEIAKVHKETAVARSALAKSFVEKSEKKRTSVAPDANDQVKEQATIDAFQIADRAVEIDPKNTDAATIRAELKVEIESILKRHIAELKGMNEAGSFAEAKTQIALLQELDGKIGKTFTNELTESEYDLYFSWAAFHEKRKNWKDAESCAQQAIAIKKTGEGTTLLKRVVNAREEEDRGEGFEQGLRNIDSCIAKGDLVAAQRLIASLTKTAAETNRKQPLDEKKKALDNAVSALYARGVKAYREEKFRDAAAALKTVVAVNPSFEDAADYLEKAQAKQKLVDQY